MSRPSAPPDSKLLPQQLQTLPMLGLALAACEKAVQIVYEHKLRTAEKLRRQAGSYRYGAVIRKRHTGHNRQNHR